MVIWEPEKRLSAKACLGKLEKFYPSPAISFRYKDPHLVDELPEIKASSVSGYSEIGPIGMFFPGRKLYELLNAV